MTSGTPLNGCHSERSEESSAADAARCANNWILRCALDDNQKRAVPVNPALLELRGIGKKFPGVVALAGVDVRPCVSQGAKPIGPEMAITAADGNVIHELASRPALERLKTAITELDSTERALAAGGRDLAVLRIVARAALDPPQGWDRFDTRFDGIRADALRVLRANVPDVKDRELILRARCVAGMLNWLALAPVGAEVRNTSEKQLERLLVPIIAGAGGIVTTWEGGSPHAGGRVVAAGDKRVHAAALELLKG